MRTASGHGTNCFTCGAPPPFSQQGVCETPEHRQCSMILLSMSVMSALPWPVVVMKMCCICLADIKPIGINSTDINHAGLKHVFIYKACSYVCIYMCMRCVLYRKGAPAARGLLVPLLVLISVCSWLLVPNNAQNVCHHISSTKSNL